jgi:hypothetical protein
MKLISACGENGPAVRTKNRGSASLAVMFQEIKQIVADEHIEIHSDLKYKVGRNGIEKELVCTSSSNRTFHGNINPMHTALR